jgi:hypothetical protein
MCACGTAQAHVLEKHSPNPEGVTVSAASCHPFGIVFRVPLSLQSWHPFGIDMCLAQAQARARISKTHSRKFAAEKE